jgi:hypothetical protein
MRCRVQDDIKNGYAMTRPIELVRQGKKEELWQMCCGFIDLSLEQVMAIQKTLLLEQIELLKNCELGRKVMRGAMPTTVEEFREQVPLTTYADYLPELVEKREDVLPAKVVRWVRTSGTSGKSYVKWVPMTVGFVRELEKVLAAEIIFSGCKSRGDIAGLKEHSKLLHTLGPPEYGTGFLAYVTKETIGCDFLPSHGDKLPFEQSVKLGFEEALYHGLDGFGGMASPLVYAGEQIKRRARNISIRFLLAHPRALFRVIRGLVKSKVARRPLLPKDLWTVRGIICGGSDATIFKKRVEELWSRRPLEHYASCEGGNCAVQTWDYEGMTFIPNLNFFEFIPEREYFKWQLDHSYQPKTVLLDEVKAGENYEIVLTNFHGDVFVRYRIGDIITITSLRNERLNIDIPQMVFYSRTDDRIDVSGFGRLTEKVIWEAIENSGIPYKDWTARKEAIRDRTILHLYLELEDDYIASEEAVAATIYAELQKLDGVYHYNQYSAYGAPETVLGLKPIKVNFLPQGAFARYISQRQAEGADLGTIKPPHINPSDKVLSLLGAPKVEMEAAPVTESERAAPR